MLIGRPDVIEERIKRFGLAIRPGAISSSSTRRTTRATATMSPTYLKVAGRKGVTPDAARTLVRTSPTVIGALALARGDADALLCGLEGRFTSRLDHIRDIVGLAPGAKDFSALSLVIAATGAYFSPTPMCATTRARRRSPTWRSPAPIMCAASASSRRSR